MKLENIATKKVEDLAPNQQYMVELAKALVQEPKLLKRSEEKGMYGFIYFASYVRIICYV